MKLDTVKVSTIGGLFVKSLNLFSVVDFNGFHCGFPYTDDTYVDVFQNEEDEYCTIATSKKVGDDWLRVDVTQRNDGQGPYYVIVIYVNHMEFNRIETVNPNGCDLNLI